METIAGTQDSDSWFSGKQNVLRIFNEFAVYGSAQKWKYGAIKSFQSMHTKILTDTKLWELFAGYLAKTYKSPKTKSPLGLDTARNYFGTMMNAAKNKCFKEEAETERGVMPTTKLFFDCLQVKSTSEEAKWYRGVRNGIRSHLFRKAVKKGTVIDHTVSPVYGQHLQKACQSYSDAGYNRENSLRKLTLICDRQSAGRPSEIAWLLLDSFHWDPYYTQIFAELPESKPQKVKLVGFVAGRSYEFCFFTSLGEMLSHQDPNFLKPTSSSEGSTVWFLRHLRFLKQPSKKITAYLQQL